MLRSPKENFFSIHPPSLISELVYKVPVSFYDPARYSFAHDGVKDGHPFPVDRETKERSLCVTKVVDKYIRLTWLSILL